MFTKRVSAGNIFRYLAGSTDSMGRRRFVEPVMMRGSSHAAIDLVAALAPRGVKPTGKQPDGWTWPAQITVKPGRRRSRDWTSHCRNHMTHLISCFHESRPKVLKHLNKIVRNTEDLILAGLPRDCLHFTWYLHEKERWTHAHGVLIEHLLPNRQHYSLALSHELQLQFDRLTSHCLGYMDPLDPRMMRLVRGAAGSWKEANETFITDICQAVDSEIRRSPQKNPLETFKSVLEGTPGVVVLAYPSATGDPMLTRAGNDQPPRLYPWTVVVSESRHTKPIYFSGPVCDPGFTLEQFNAERLQRDKLVQLIKTPDGCSDFFQHFERRLKKRIESQRDLCPDSIVDRVQLSDFQWLNPLSSEFLELEADRKLTEESDRQLDFSDSHHAFLDFRLETDLKMDLSFDATEDPDFVSSPEAESLSMVHRRTLTGTAVSSAPSEPNIETAQRGHTVDRVIPPIPTTEKQPPSMAVPLDAAQEREKLKRARKKLAIQMGIQLAVQQETELQHAVADETHELQNETVHSNISTDRSGPHIK